MPTASEKRNYSMFLAKIVIKLLFIRLLDTTVYKIIFLVLMGL